MTITEVVTKKLKLFSRRKVVTLLSGNYDSLFRGRGLEIDSLREYIVGDDVKDIDWKATARTAAVHTRVYTALRDQRVIVVADTSRSMLLPGYSGLHKQDALYAVCVMLGSFVKRNQDLMALCAADPTGRVIISRYSNTSRHLEAILRTIDKTLHAPTNAEATPAVLGKRLLGATKRRSAIFIVTDGMPPLKEVEDTIHTLSRRHQVFYVQLAPTWPFMSDVDDQWMVQDIEAGQTISPDTAASKVLQSEWRSQFDNWYAQTDQLCRNRGIPHGLITDAEQAATVLREMFMQAKRYALRRR